MRKIICAVLTALFICVGSAQAAEFSIPGKIVEIKQPAGVVAMDDIAFERDSDKKRINVLDKHHNKVLTLETGKWGYFGVERVVCKNPNKIFYSIVNAVGAHGELGGYWLIGQHKNKWVVYVSYDSLKSMGAHPIFWKSPRANGDTLLYHTFYNVPPGGKLLNGHESNIADIELFWDEKAQWFGMRRVK